MQYTAAATSDSSDFTSLSSSPTRRPLYYVESPSIHSRDEEACKISFHSSTSCFTPLPSPLLSTHHNDNNNKPSLRKVLPRDRDSSPLHKLSKPWATLQEAAAEAAEEEEEVGSFQATHNMIYYAVLVSLSGLIFLLLFIFFFWLICKPQHPQLSVKNVVFHNFFLGQGADVSGVPTNMVTLNCTVQLIFRNPSKYFRANVDLIDVSLDYSQLYIASGQMESYVQAKHSWKAISVAVEAVKVPLYGAGGSISYGNDGNSGVIPLSMVASVRSEFDVVGKLVKSRFLSQATCSLHLHPTTLFLLRNSCVYDPPHSP